MTEKRFRIYKEDKFKEEWYDYPFHIKDGGEKVTGTMPRGNAEEVANLLNSLAEENEQLRRYVYHCPQICNIILAYLRKCESEDVKAVNDAMGDDKYFDDDIDTLRSWE